MRKATIAFIGALCVLSLTGCSGDLKSIIDEKMSESILEQSGITEDTDYLHYKSLQMDGTLDNDEFYVKMMQSEEETFRVSETKDKVHVTFAENSNLSADYYLDAELSEPVDQTNCYLGPNDFLYATIFDINSDYGELYVFSGYRVVEYDDLGKVTGTLEWANDVERNIVFQVPMDYKGTDISVMPIGEYEDCKVILNDYRIKDDGDMADLGGTWYVNNNKVTSDTTSVSPIESISVKYKYTEGEYFFVSSSPTCYANEQGEVSFYSAENLDKELSYSVELHPYISTTISLDKKIKGSYIIKDSQNIRKGDTVIIDNKKSFDIKQLEYGDQIIITTDKQCDITTNCDQVSEPSEEAISGGYIYVLKITSNHMPNLSLILKENVGDNSSFSLTTSDGTIDNLKYSDKAFQSEKTVIDQIVSTKDGIQIAVKDSLLGENEAFKFVIKQTDKGGHQLVDTQYLATDSKSMDIAVEKGISGNQVYIKNIEIIISRIEAHKYKPKTITNALISLKARDDGQLISSSAVVDGNREVTVTIKPDAGYYVDGYNNMSGDSYVKTMTFSDYMKKISDIIEEYPIKKFICVTLDTTDSYGTCTFMVDGKEVSGELKLKDSQKLTLKYKITDSNYQIVYDNSGLLRWITIFKPKTEQDEQIELSSILDGKTICREDYFEVKKKGE